MAWFRPGASEDEIKQDLAMCKFHSHCVVGAAPQMQGNTVGQTVLLNMLSRSDTAQQYNDFVQLEMTTLGYVLIKTNSFNQNQTNFVAGKTTDENSKLIISLRKKAKLGDFVSECLLANCYYYGSCGLPKDDSQAKIWYERAKASRDPQPPNGNLQVTPNAYGLGVNADQYGRPTTYQLQDGQQLAPIFNSGVKQNAYGPGVGMDQFGRPVYNSPQ